MSIQRMMNGFHSLIYKTCRHEETGISSFDHLPVWSEGNVYLDGAKAWKHEKNGFVSSENVKVELTEKDGKYFLDTNIYEILEAFSGRMINTEVLGKAFEPEEFFENPDGTPITFDTDYLEDTEVPR